MIKNDDEIIKELFDEYLLIHREENYALEIWQYDRTTTQLFVTSVGDFTDEIRKDLQNYLRQGVKKVLVNEVIV